MECTSFEQILIANDDPGDGRDVEKNVGRASSEWAKEGGRRRIKMLWGTGSSSGGEKGRWARGGG